jgi:hypothetical protein
VREKTMAEVNLEELAEMVADTVLDKFEYEGKTIREWVQEIIEADHVGKWIPVSEKLPEEGKTVMASTNYGIYPEARYSKKYGWRWPWEVGEDYWTEIVDDVEAWMPLPEPYKAESENET